MEFRLFRDKAPETVDFTQDDATVELNKRITDMVRVAEQDDDGWQKIADDGVDYTYGNQLKYINLKEGWEPIQCNFIFPAMMQQAALVQQQKTTIYANPREDMDLSQKRLDRFTELKQVLADYGVAQEQRRKQVVKAEDTDHLILDPSTRAALEALGYLAD